MCFIHRNRIREGHRIARGNANIELIVRASRSTYNESPVNYSMAGNLLWRATGRGVIDEILLKFALNFSPLKRRLADICNEDWEKNKRKVQVS